MKRSNDYPAVMQKIQELNRNCGVKLRSREESDLVIEERLDQLRINQQTETPEYKFLLAVQSRKEAELDA